MPLSITKPDRPHLVAAVVTASTVMAVIYPAVRATLMTVGDSARTEGAGLFATLMLFTGHLMLYAGIVWAIGGLLTLPIWWALSRAKGPFPLVATLLAGSVTSIAVMAAAAFATQGLVTIAIVVALGALAGAAVWAVRNREAQS
jgi:hypothetical protein